MYNIFIHDYKDEMLYRYVYIDTWYQHTYLHKEKIFYKCLYTGTPKYMCVKNERIIWIRWERIPRMGLSQPCRAALSPPGSLQDFPPAGNRESPWLSKHGKAQKKNRKTPKDTPKVTRGEPLWWSEQELSSITSPLPPCPAEPAFFIFTFPLTPHIFLNLALLLTREVAEWKKESANRQVRGGLSRPRLPISREQAVPARQFQLSDASQD